MLNQNQNITRIAVLVSGGGTNLQALIDAQTRGDIPNGKIALVLSSNPNAYALQRAEQAAIPTCIVSRKAYASSEAYTQAILDKLQEQDIQLVVLAGFMTILTAGLFQKYTNAVINVHPALIPSFCGKGAYGLHVHEMALAYGVKVSGATVHFVTEECDAGPVILQKAIDILPDDTPERLQRRIMEQCEWKLLPQAVRLFCQGRLEVQGRVVRILPESFS